MSRLGWEERFWAKVGKTGDCWEWSAAKTSGGYGVFNLPGGVQKCSHRISYELAHGDIPAGMDVDHSCRNRACVRPEHLRAATRKQNMENRSGARRGSSSGIRGVTWHRGKQKWHSSVGHNGKSYHAGYFTSLVDAEASVIAKRNELFTHNDADRVEAAA